MVESINTKADFISTRSGPANPSLSLESTDSSQVTSARDKSFIKELNELPKVQELKTMPVLNTASNFVKKNLSRSFKFAGFVGASFSIITYFLFNLKSLAVLFGIPAAMSFYIAHTLSKSAKKDTMELSTNPHQILQNAINNPRVIETNLVPVLQATEQIKDMKDSDPKKVEGIQLIEDLNTIVDSKLMQLEGFEDQDSVALKHELERFKTSYDEMKNTQENKSRTEERNEKQKSLHSPIG